MDKAKKQRREVMESMERIEGINWKEIGRLTDLIKDATEKIKLSFLMHKNELTPMPAAVLGYIGNMTKTGSRLAADVESFLSDFVNPLPIEVVTDLPAEYFDLLETLEEFSELIKEVNEYTQKADESQAGSGGEK